jgi:hypothetical protein
MTAVPSRFPGFSQLARSGAAEDLGMSWGAITWQGSLGAKTGATPA